MIADKELGIATVISSNSYATEVYILFFECRKQFGVLSVLNLDRVMEAELQPASATAQSHELSHAVLAQDEGSVLPLLDIPHTYQSVVTQVLLSVQFVAVCCKRKDSVRIAVKHSASCARGRAPFSQ